MPRALHAAATYPGEGRAQGYRFATQMPAPTRPSAANTAGVSGSLSSTPPASTPITGVAGGVLLGEALTLAVFAALGLVGAGIWVANRPS